MSFLTRVKSNKPIRINIIFRSIYSSSTARRLTSTMSHPNEISDDETKTESASKDSTVPSSKPLALPAIPPNEDGVKMDMSNGNASVSLDHLGPIVVGTDGSISRISNWNQMAEIEQKNTIRIISSRNKVRLEARRAEMEGESEASSK